jgi:hypothetical protein
MKGGQLSGGFLAVLSKNRNDSHATQLFRIGLRFSVDRIDRTATLETETKLVAACPRLTDTDARAIAQDPDGNWLLAAGTWFHVDDHIADEAALLARYLEAGPEGLANELEGFFVIVIGDAATDEAIVITDLVGSCHAFVRQFDEFSAISSSSLALAAMGRYTLDPVGCQEFLNTGIIYEDRTLWREVRKLPGASIIRFSGGRLQQPKRYWRMADLAYCSIDSRSAPQLLAERLSSAAAKIARRYSRLVCDLTAGYDSRALIAGFLAADVRFSTTVSGAAESADVRLSTELARRLGLAHSHVVPNEPITYRRIGESITLTDGEYDPVDYARILGIHRILSERFDISINGSFGEVGRGYWWELLWPRAGTHRPLDARRLARLRYAARPYDTTLFRADVRLDMVEHFAGVVERTNAGWSALPNTAQMDHAYLEMRMQRWQGRIASSTNRLWPCLSPFMF